MHNGDEMRRAKAPAWRFVSATRAEGARRVDSDLVEDRNRMRTCSKSVRSRCGHGKL